MVVEGYPAPLPGRIEPVNCVRAVARLIRDKEQTDAVFEIMRTLLGRSHIKGFQRFLATPAGRQVIDEERDLVAMLINRAALSVLPEGSFGRAYYEFVIREGLMLELLIEASADLDRRADLDPARYPEFMRYVHRMRYCHDLWHVLVGHGRDGVGEACNVAFSYSQTKVRGFAAIAWLVGAHFQKQAKGYPVMKAVREGFRIGREAKWFLGEDIEALLRRPLEEVRATLNIKPPVIYQSIPREVLDRIGKPEEAEPQEPEAAA